MNEKINQELMKLQQELSLLDNAVQHINKAGEISTEVIESAKTLQTKYEEHVDQILKLINEHLNNSYRHFESQVNELITVHKNKVNEESQLISDFTKASEAANDKNSQQLSEILTVTQEVLSKSYINTEEQIRMIAASHREQIADVNKLLGSYLELAQETAKLTDQIEKVDFPAKMDQMNVKVTQIQSEVEKISSDNSIALLSEKINKYSSKMGTVMFITIVTFLLVLLGGGFGMLVLIKHFPNVFSNLF